MCVMSPIEPHYSKQYRPHSLNGVYRAFILQQPRPLPRVNSFQIS